MKQYLKDKELRPGYYLNLTNGEFVHIGKTQLPPLKPDYRLIKIPAAGLMVIAPVIALGYVIFLPFAGIASLVVYGGMKVKRAVQAMARAHEEEVTPGRP